MGNELEDIETVTVHLTLPREMMERAFKIVDESGLGYEDFEEFVREAVRDRIIRYKERGKG